MLNDYKIKTHWIIILCMAFCSLTSFAQEIRDTEIGFNPDKIRAALTERKLSPTQIEEVIKSQKKAYQIKAVQLENIRKEQALKYFPKIEDNTAKNTKVNAQNKNALSDVPVEERNALIALYLATQEDGPWRNYYNWNTSEPVSSWEGVTVVNNHVTMLKLYNNNMKGQIPDISALKNHLTELSFDGNSLSGSFENLGKLTALTSLNVNNNLFDGNLEPITNLIKLKHFSATDANINGEIPSNISQLSQLISFSVVRNNLTGGLSNLGINHPNLESLDLSGNNFTNTTIPGSFQNLPSLKILKISNSKLSQGLQIIGGLTKLEHLELDQNRFSGPLPSNFQNLINLNLITMRDNNITDIAVLSTLNMLKNIWFDSNQIETNLSSFSNSKNLNTLTLSFNKITGIIPGYQNLDKLQELNFNYNKLGGIVPQITLAQRTWNYGYGFDIAGNNFRFIDLNDTFVFYSNLGYDFNFYPQSDTDTSLSYTKAQGETVTLEMCTDQRYLPGDTFQWYKDDEKIPGAEARILTINSFNNATDKGVYYCLSNNNAMPPYFALARNKIYLNGSNCTEVPGEIITLNNGRLSSSQILNFTFQTTATNLKYHWKVYSPDHQLIDQGKEQNFTLVSRYTDLRIELIVTDANQCKTSFTKQLKLDNECSIDYYRRGYLRGPIYDTPCTEEKVTYSFDKNFPETSLTYKWYLYDKNFEILSTGNEPEFTVLHHSITGERLRLYVIDQNGCVTEYNHEITAKYCNSCTNTNEKSAIIKKLSLDLLKSLALKSARGETDAQINGSKPPELIALKEHIKNSSADQIYNFVTTRNHYNELTSIQFSFDPAREYDVYFVHSYGLYYNPEEDYLPDFSLDMTQYMGYDNPLITCESIPTKMVKTKDANPVLNNKLGCGIGLSIQNVDFCPEKVIKEKYCVKEPVYFNFETTSTSLNYTWTITDATGKIVEKVTTTTGSYTFTPQVAGTYQIELAANSATQCNTIFTEKVVIEDCVPFISCTKDNEFSPEIQRLFITLITKLASTPNGSDANVYARKEIAALAPYTTEKKIKIYNFSNAADAISFSFSEGATEKDVYLPKATSGSITAIDLSKYVDSLQSTSIATTYSDGTANTSDGHVKNIDFCPKELSCVSHVALVIDESGSVDETEFNKIKKQLKSFVLQQAKTNEEIGSNIHVSITGMSDNDKNLRTDFISPTKMTMSSVVQFNDWIDKLGIRYGETGISQASDYWKSGLDGALAYEMKPNFVLMITDGAQTDDVEGLRRTFKMFNNNNKTENKLPHLYVVGLENGFYIDKESSTNKTLSRDQDPNYNPSLGANNNLTGKTTSFLSKSLQYLLDLPTTEFPLADLNQFTVGTYYAHTNFNLLASDVTYFSDKLAEGGVVCGLPSIKDFCDDCFSFKPEPGKEYILSAWVKEESITQLKTYENPAIKIIFYNKKEALDIPIQVIDSLIIKANGDIIDGWQRVVKKFKIPTATITMAIKLENMSLSIPVYFDDIRIHPLQGSVKSFVYDPETFKLMSELDENNYGTFYEYDNEGGLVRVKKETAKGIKTIQETRSGNFINTTP
jgi:Leucine-rich repeat (LRR) protein